MADWLHTIGNAVAVLIIVGAIAIGAIAAAPDTLPQTVEVRQ